MNQPVLIRVSWNVTDGLIVGFCGVRYQVREVHAIAIVKSPD